MKTIRFTLCVSILLLTTWAYGAAPQPRANAVQVELSGELSCTQDVTILQTTLDTVGGPVLVSVSLNYFEEIQGGFSIKPVIDGQHAFNDKFDFGSGLVTQQESMSMTRLYSVPAGTHHLWVEVSECRSQVRIFRGWLNAYELPLLRP